MYQVFYTRSASKDYKKIPHILTSRIMSAVEGLASNPRPAQVEKLAGSENAYRIRRGDYRVLFTVDDQKKAVVVYKVAHRREVYR